MSQSNELKNSFNKRQSPIVPNVGIGSTSPAYKLDVTGTIRTTQAVLNSSGVPTISACGTTPPVTPASNYTSTASVIFNYTCGGN